MRTILLIYAGITSTTDIIESVLSKVAVRTDAILVSRDSCLVTKKDISDADVIVFSRGADPYMARIAEAAKNAGRYCILYLDDDLYGLNQDNVYGEALLKCLDNCDVLWASNPKIIEKYKAFNELLRGVITKVYMEIKELNKPEPVEDEIRILYAGSPAHRQIIQEVIVPALNRVNSEMNSIRVFFAGLDKDSLLDCKFDCKYIPWVNDASEYREQVKRIRPQIGIGIIPDTEFGNCKFYNKWLEYTKLGVAGIYSNVTPYQLIVKSGINGILTNNTVDAWEEAILTLTSDDLLRMKIITNAQIQMQEEFIDYNLAAEIIKKIPELNFYKAPDKRIVYTNVRLLGLIRGIWRRVRA